MPVLHRARQADAPFEWKPGFQSPGGNGLNTDGGEIFALTEFDSGTGPALYAGGFFTMAGGLPANYVAKWDGTTWTPLGSGMSNIVQTFAVFDDGTGAALYAGGFFKTAGGVAANSVAKWDGT